MSWRVYTSVAKGLKLQLKKCLGLIPTFVEVKGELGLTHKSKNWMKRATLSKTKLRNLSCGFIYSMINHGSTEHDIISLIKASPSITMISSLRVPVYNKMRENSITLATENWIFRSSSLFQSNCTHRSNEQATCFYFLEMSWLLAEHKGRVLKAEGRVPYNRTAGGCWLNLITLFFSRFTWYSSISI